MRLTGVALRRDRPKFDADRVLTLFKMGERVAVPTNTAMELAPAAKRAARKAQPKVFLEIAFGAMRQPLAPHNNRHRAYFNPGCRHRKRGGAHAPDAGMWPVVS